MDKLLKIKDPLKLEKLLNKEFADSLNIKEEDINWENIEEKKIMEDPLYKKITELISEEQKDNFFINLENQKEVLEEFDLKIFNEIEEIDINLNIYEQEINENMTKIENDFLEVYKKKQIIQKEIDFESTDKIKKKLEKVEKEINLKEIKKNEVKIIECEKKISHLDNELKISLEKSEKDTEKISFDIDCVENDINIINKKQNDKNLQEIKELIQNLKNEIEQIIKSEKINMERQTEDCELQDVCLEKLKLEYNDLIHRGNTKLEDLKTILNDFNKKHNKK